MNDYRAWAKDRHPDLGPIPVPEVKPRSILDEAAEVTSGDRQDWYGSPVDNHGCTAALWNAYLDRRALRTGTVNSIDAYDVCLLNALQKISRLAHDRRRDGLVDIAGYAANAAEIVAELDAAWTT